MPAGTNKGVMPKEESMPDDDGSNDGGETQSQEGQQGQSQEPDENAGLKSALQKERDARKQLERRLGDYDALKDKASRFDKLSKEHQTDQERAVAEASTSAKAEASREWGTRLVHAELRGRLAGRIGDDATRLQTALDNANTSRFIANDGTVRADDLQAYVDLVAPATRPRVPDTGGGQRGGPVKNNDMSSLIRQQAGRTS